DGVDRAAGGRPGEPVKRHVGEFTEQIHLVAAPPPAPPYPPCGSLHDAACQDHTGPPGVVHARWSLQRRFYGSVTVSVASSLRAAILGTPAGRRGRCSPRATSTARSPARRAPSTSVTSPSPAWWAAGDRSQGG